MSSIKSLWSTGLVARVSVGRADTFRRLVLIGGMLIGSAFLAVLMADRASADVPANVAPATGSGVESPVDPLAGPAGILAGWLLDPVTELTTPLVRLVESTPDPGATALPAASPSIVPPSEPVAVPAVLPAQTAPPPARMVAPVADQPVVLATPADTPVPVDRDRRVSGERRTNHVDTAVAVDSTSVVRRTDGDLPVRQPADPLGPAAASGPGTTSAGSFSPASFVLSSAPRVRPWLGSRSGPPDREPTWPRWSYHVHEHPS